ncbi:progestin and adipoQ receptor family member 4 [Vanessa tameamea]|uniref:Progestin and adipoQ receptor family member 4 n=1 Tax=Vanessa tameamea TaxID=334116 RepID=A0A8B8HLP1_VANTA|nr:progestin and adipoQ receptor family member 4 isoform X1 [Vanessa tameamea]XP_047531795.1 progestin and adipoQ receptor family member 4 [Vanessa atalanta]
MRDIQSVPDTCTKIFDMSIQEVNGKGPKKRKKSLEQICDNEGQRAELNENAREENEEGSEKNAGPRSSRAEVGEGVELLHWRDMPKHLQFNPYVLTGYRPLQSWGGCVRSLFYFHNETINILTHGVSLVFMIAVLPGLLPWSGGGAGAWFLSMCHLLGALAPWCGSFLYHLFMNHTQGATLYHRLLQLDMLGIWVSQSIGAIPMVTATVYCASAPLRYAALAVYCLGSLLGLYKAMRAWSPWERRLCFAAPFCMRLLLAGARTARLGGGDPHAILHVFLQDAVSLGGGVIGALHIPEKWFPGSVDRCLNSHNIMHVLVVLAVYSMHQVTTKDLAWMSSVDCRAPLHQL